MRVQKNPLVVAIVLVVAVAVMVAVGSENICEVDAGVRVQKLHSPAVVVVPLVAVVMFVLIALAAVAVIVVVIDCHEVNFAAVRARKNPPKEYRLIQLLRWLHDARRSF